MRGGATKTISWQVYKNGCMTMSSGLWTSPMAMATASLIARRPNCASAAPLGLQNYGVSFDYSSNALVTRN